MLSITRLLGVLMISDLWEIAIVSVMCLVPCVLSSTLLAVMRNVVRSAFFRLGSSVSPYARRTRPGTRDTGAFPAPCPSPNHFVLP